MPNPVFGHQDGKGFTAAIGNGIISSGCKKRQTTRLRTHSILQCVNHIKGKILCDLKKKLLYRNILF